MNYVERFLTANRRRLLLEQYGLGEGIACVVVTPRFRASSHVIFLVMAQGNTDPALVAKVPRLAHAGAGLEREAAGLKRVQALHREGLDTVPRLVAFEEFGGRPILLQTALVGRGMDPPLVRRRPTECCEAALTWLESVSKPLSPWERGRGEGSPPEEGVLKAPLVNVADSLRAPSASEVERFERLVIEPLEYFAEVVPLSIEEERALERTRILAERLRGASLPAVLEHGDFSHPNVLLLKDGRVGVVDWELADLEGLPTHDLFFFLTYAAFAREGARENGRFVPAFHQAFFEPGAWARRYVVAYAERLQLSEASLTPLFLMCWVRYLSGLLQRLNQRDDSRAPLPSSTADWLRQNRYYALWRHTLDHLDQIDWSDAFGEEKTRSLAETGFLHHADVR